MNDSTYTTICTLTITTLDISSLSYVVSHRPTCLAFCLVLVCMLYGVYCGSVWRICGSAEPHIAIQHTYKVSWGCACSDFDACACFPPSFCLGTRPKAPPSGADRAVCRAGWALGAIRGVGRRLTSCSCPRGNGPRVMDQCCARGAPTYSSRATRQVVAAHMASSASALARLEQRLQPMSSAHSHVTFEELCYLAKI
jgi:hypothetical protein